MRFTVAFRQAAIAATASQPRKKSLALSVYFKQPDFGMEDYEILSRATCYLLGVDQPEQFRNEGPYGHLKEAEYRRKLKEHKHTHKYSPAAGEGRPLMELGWLEFVPKEVRPQVHVVASSHVLSPFLWKDYYPQDWLSQVRQEHCTYSLEVYDHERPEEALVKLALNSEPFHHPEGRDLALIHFQEEKSSLSALKKVGVDILRLRDPEKLYQKGEQMFFDGFVVSEQNKADADNMGDAMQKEEVNEDLRVFHPYKEKGTLAFHTDDRFFATTPQPLPEGLCGAPVLDEDGDLCGTVEGIVPVTHPNKNLAGCAAFLPSFTMQAFVDYVERGLLQQMMPQDLFQMVVNSKKTNSIGGGVFRADGKGGYTTETNWDEAHDLLIERLKQKYDKEEVDSIMKTIERERDEVLETWNKEGGDLDDIIKKVRAKTLQVREMIIDQYRKEVMEKPKDDEQAEKSG